MYFCRSLLIICIVISIGREVLAQACPGSLPSGMSCVASGTNSDITAHSVCAKVTNNHSSGMAIMVPGGNSTEWSDFRTKAPSGVTIGACGASVTPESVHYMTGFETGDGVELNLSGGTPISGVSGATGTYAYRMSSTQTTPGGWATTLTYQMRVSGTDQTAAMTLAYKNTSTCALLTWAADGSLSLGSNATSGIASTISAGSIPRDGTWARIGFAYDPAANGAVKVWVDGTLKVDTTHTTSCNGQSFEFNTTSVVAIYGDDLVGVQSITSLPDIRVVSPLGLSTTPTHNAFTKSNASTIDTVWNDRPQSSVTYANSSGSGAAQTMKIGAVSGVIHGCRSYVLALRGGGGTCNVSHRRIVGGVTTDTLIGELETFQKKYTGPIFQPSTSEGSSMEAGVVRDACTGQETTVRDVWMTCAYTP